VNLLNELTTNTNGGTLTVMGTTTPLATNVTVNTSNAVLYGDYTFAATNMLLATNFTALALGNGLAATNAVAFNLVSNAVFQYDGNGNLTNDGWRNLAYDDENQLIQVSVPNQWMSQFVYDGKMRRRIRTEFTWESGSWVQTNQVRYVYDGNLVVQERGTNNLPLVTYTRGRDLSGSLEGADGIGGLLARTDTNGSSYYHADGNGNVAMLVNSSQAVAAKYVYDAFGNLISKSGPLADANLYRFSSKEAHSNSGLDYYLYRYYDPNLQRWPNRDPIGEPGGLNLYDFTQNDPVNNRDALGLDVYKVQFHSQTPCLDHREIIGDDGLGNAYILSYGPRNGGGIYMVGTHTVCGAGQIDYALRKSTSAASVVSNMSGKNGFKVDKIVYTTGHTMLNPNLLTALYSGGFIAIDQELGLEAKNWENPTQNYIFLWHDCGTDANNWIKRAERYLTDSLY
jgi:RHS repeat-associated protein